MNIRTRFRSLALAMIGVAAIIGMTVGPASAHFGVRASTTAAGAYSLLTFSYSHGCDGSATNQVTIAIPEGITVVRPGIHFNWDIEVVRDEENMVTDSHGNEIAPITEVVYTAKEAVADGFYDSFEVQVQLPETPGEDLYFPVIQTCDEGEHAWIQIPAEGSDEVLDEPAPFITITEAEEGGH